MARLTEHFYCLLQQSLDPIDPEALKVAFRAVGELVDHDARILAADAFGILADGLSAETARTVANELAALGVGVSLVHEEQIPELPHPQTLRRCGCYEDGFVATDALGRDVPLDFSEVLLISAGAVRQYRTDRQLKIKHKARSVAWDLASHRSYSALRGLGGMLGANVDSVPEQNLSIRYKQVTHGLLDIFTTCVPYRYRVMADKFNYSYLADRRSSDEMANFVSLVNDLMAHADRAALNRGAVAIREEGLNAAFNYPTEHAFEEETTWILYQFQQQRGRPWPWESAF